MKLKSSATAKEKCGFSISFYKVFIWKLSCRGCPVAQC